MSEWRKSLSLVSCNLDGIKKNMKFCNLVKLMDQYCGKKFQPCRGFQSKWPELFHVKGSLAVHAPPLESNLAGALMCPQTSERSEVESWNLSKRCSVLLQTFFKNFSSLTTSIFFHLMIRFFSYYERIKSTKYVYFFIEFNTSAFGRLEPYLFWL